MAKTVETSNRSTIRMSSDEPRLTNLSAPHSLAAKSWHSENSASIGPGTRANIDEFTRTTRAGVEQVGKAKLGKAIIVINPAEGSSVAALARIEKYYVDLLYALASGS